MSGFLPMLSTVTAADVANAVWDVVLTGATHNIPTSAGRRVRQLSSVVVHDGIAQGAGTGTNQIQLDTGASSVNGSYDPSLISIVGGTGAGQTRLILQYNGATRTATVDRDWRTLPNATSEFIITGDAGRDHVNEGLAQGGTSTTIILNADAATQDDTYNGQLVFIRSGIAADQVRLVTDYVGATRTATINVPWGTIPTSQSAYIMIPDMIFTAADIRTVLAPELDAIDEIHTRDGLKLGSPLTVTKTTISAGDISLTLSGDGENTTTVTRDA